MQWNIHPETGRTRRICEALLLLLLFGLTACLSIRLTDCLWPLFFETKTILWAWAEWLGLPAWLSAPIIHGAFCAVSCTLLVMLPPLFLLFPMLGLLGRSGCFLWAVYLSDLITEFFIEKPCNTVRRYKSYGIFSTLFSCTADHTIPILDRAAAAAVPTGILIWFLGSMAYVGPATDSSAFLSPGMDGGSLLEAIIRFFDHPARLICLDGTILTAFILGIFFSWNGASRHDDDISENRRHPFPFIPLHPRTADGKSRMDLAHSPVHLSHGPDPLSKPYCLPEAAQKARPLPVLPFRTAAGVHSRHHPVLSRRSDRQSIRLTPSFPS